MESVAWVDVMGIQSALARSVKVAANFVYKLHHAALTVPNDLVRLYPVMDGFYATSEFAQALARFLAGVFELAAREFIDESNPSFRFLIRGAVAKGNIYHGYRLSAQASWTLAQHQAHRDMIVLGTPIVDAHLGEREAPPFGIFADRTADDFERAGYPFDAWWPWYRLSSDSTLAARLADNLEEYYEWAGSSDESGYDESRIRIHRGFASLYFRDG